MNALVDAVTNLRSVDTKNDDSISDHVNAPYIVPPLSALIRPGKRKNTTNALVDAVTVGGHQKRRLYTMDASVFLNDPQTRTAIHAPTSKDWVEDFYYPFGNSSSVVVFKGFSD
jgi:hypothetical protein